MLTVAIPTYNRAEHLDRQLSWLARAIASVDDRWHDQIEVFVSDNASPDATPEVVERWRTAFTAVDFRHRRNPENVGAVRNVASCIGAARCRHVWTIGDDDHLDDDALAVVLGVLGEMPELGLLTLNFSSRYVTTGLQRFARCYPVAGTQHDPAGTALFTSCLDLDEGGLALTTAQIYRTDLAVAAQAAWPTTDNLAVQIYWSAYCARHGGMVLTGDTHFECAAGTHFFLFDPMLHLRLQLADLPEVGDQLAELGYDRRVCAELTFKQLVPNALAVARRAFREDRRATLQILAGFARAVWRAGPFRAVAYVARAGVHRWRSRGQRLDRGRPSEAR